ncbi:MAG: proton-conducting transporter membrane subunit [Elusimicrobia bacterium]|nr:proton-conducting transporter membrane subunit [Elusimicrobiota bacterium]
MLIVFFIIIPLSALILISIARHLNERILDFLAFLATLANAILSAIALKEISSKGPIVFQIGNWPLNLGINLVMDGLSVFISVTINVLALIVSIYSVEYMSKYSGKWKYYCLFMLALIGLNGVLISGDLFNLFVFSEIALMAGYILSSFNNEAENFEAAFRYAVIGSFSSMLILLAIAFIYSKFSSLSLFDLALNWNKEKTGFDIFVVILLISGFAMKAAQVPFHAWVPDAYSSAPAPIAGFYAGAMVKVLGIYVLIRLFYNVIGMDNLTLTIFSTLGVVSIIIGVILALYQWDFKRLLAYHSISQLGYIVLGIGLGTPLGIIGGLFHLLNHSVFKPLLFLNAGSIGYSAGTKNLNDLGGLAQKMPVTGTTSMIASLSIAGIPPLNGFWSKLIIIVACIQSQHYWLAFFAVIGSILTLSSFLKVQRYIFYGHLKEAWNDIKEVPFLMTLPMTILAICCIFLGILLLPGIYEHFLGLAVNSVLAGKEYAMILGVIK